MRLSENDDKAMNSQGQEYKGARKNINQASGQTLQDDPLQGNGFQGSHKLEQRIFYFHFSSSSCLELVSLPGTAWQNSS